MRIYCETYGCAANQSDIELILGQIAATRHEVVSSLAEADMVIFISIKIVEASPTYLLGVKT